MGFPPSLPSKLSGDHLGRSPGLQVILLPMPSHHHDSGFSPGGRHPKSFLPECRMSSSEPTTGVVAAYSGGSAPDLNGIPYSTLLKGSPIRLPIKEPSAIEAESSVMITCIPDKVKPNCQPRCHVHRFLSSRGRVFSAKVSPVPLFLAAS